MTVDPAESIRLLEGEVELLPFLEAAARVPVTSSSLMRLAGSSPRRRCGWSFPSSWRSSPVGLNPKQKVRRKDDENVARIRRGRVRPWPVARRREGGGECDPRPDTGPMRLALSFRFASASIGASSSAPPRSTAENHVAATLIGMSSSAPPPRSRERGTGY